MLTPQEISKTEFVKAVFGGYDMSAVDDFLEKLTADYSALYKENAILKSKIRVLVEKVEEYRSTEDSMRMALLTAQKMGDDLMNEARAKSEAIITEAQSKAKSINDDYSRGLAGESSKLKTAKEATAKYVEDSRELIKKHLEFLAKLKDIDVPEIAAQQAVAAPKVAPEEAKEEKIMDAAIAIDSAVSKLYDEDENKNSDMSAENGADEPTKSFRMKKGKIDWDDEGEPTSPRPKFNFNDLKFGENYDEE